MKLPGFLLQILGLTMLLTGAWWVLQGMGWIGDPAHSYIVGRQEWAFGGAAVFALGGIVFGLSRRFRD